MSHTTYEVPGQSNLSTVNTFFMGKPAPIIAERIWDTKTKAEAYIADVDGSAFPGMRISITMDGNNNGLYYVKGTLNSTTNLLERPYSLVKVKDVNDTDTNTWRNVYTDGISSVGTGVDTKAINYKAGNNITLSYEASGTGEGQSGSADYFNVKIDATDTNTWRNLYTDGTSRVGTGIDTKAINITHGDNISITYKAAGTGTDQSGSADYFNVEISATNTDTKTTQTGITTNGNYPILFKNTANTTDETDQVKFGKTTGKLITVNPSSGTITAINFDGKINNHTVNKDVPSNAVFTDTTYSSGNEITIGTGNAINHNVKLTGGFTPGTTGTTISGWGGSGSFEVPVLTINEYGHVTKTDRATISISLPSEPEMKIVSYTTPTYDTAHVSNTYKNIIQNNVVAVNDTFDSGINKIDNKLKGLTDEVILDEAALSRAIEDEPRYFAKSSSGAAVTAMIATLVDSRNFAIENNKPINGTKVDVYFSTAHTTESATLNINDTGAFTLVYNDTQFDTTLIDAGTTLSLVFDKEYNNNTGCYRVVGGVGECDLQPIWDALESMETWPTVTTTQNSISPTTLSVSTNNVPSSINSYYKIDDTVIPNGAVVLVGKIVKIATNITVTVSATFTPSTDETYTAQNRITGMQYGYKDTLSDTTKHTETSKITSTNVTPTFTRNNVSGTSNTVLELFTKVNSGAYTQALSVNNSGGSSSISLTSDSTVITLTEGATKLQLKYTNPSKISRAVKTYSIDAVSAYFSSNINNFDSSHYKSISAYSGSLPAVSDTYATGSSQGVKTGNEFTIYAVYPLKTNGSYTSPTPITGILRTAGSSGSTINNFASLVNYVANASSNYYVSFGQIKINDQTVTKSYIYVPNGKTLTSCQGANSLTGSYDTGTVNMYIQQEGTEIFDGVTYKKYCIKNAVGTTSEGANSYKITITSYFAI
jgi:hypothetical protein